LNDWTSAHDIHVPSLPAPGSTEESAAGQDGPGEQVHGAWGLSWCREKWWGSVLAVFTGTNPTLRVSCFTSRISTRHSWQIIKLDPSPTALLHLTPSSSTSPLTSVAWAPSCGRSYHLVATGARDGTVRIWRIEPQDKDGWSSEVVGEFGKGGARVAMVDVSPRDLQRTS